MQAFAGVCHQLPSRSPHIDGVALAVCHRCLGTYLGLPAAVLIFSSLRGLWPFSRKAAPWVLLGAAIPAIVDWSGDVLGIWTNTPVSRMITGGILGLFAGYFLVAAIVDAFVGRKRNRAPASGSTSAESRKQSDQPVIADDP